MLVSSKGVNSRNSGRDTGGGQLIIKSYQQMDIHLRNGFLLLFRRRIEERCSNLLHVLTEQLHSIPRKIHQILQFSYFRLQDLKGLLINCSLVGIVLIFDLLIQKFI